MNRIISYYCFFQNLRIFSFGFDLIFGIGLCLIKCRNTCLFKSALNIIGCSCFGRSFFFIADIMRLDLYAGVFDEMCQMSACILGFDVMNDFSCLIVFSKISPIFMRIESHIAIRWPGGVHLIDQIVFRYPVNKGNQRSTVFNQSASGLSIGDIDLLLFADL